MNKKSDLTKDKIQENFVRHVEKKAIQKLKARKNPQSAWFGLGMMGLVGWSVMVPTLLGAWLGHWLDKQYSTTFSWTLALLVAGLGIGCLNAWYWVSQQNTLMHKELDEEQKNE
jgi:ATP synthase protein I